jgi:hypothetical protein
MSRLRDVCPRPHDVGGKDACPLGPVDLLPIWTFKLAHVLGIPTLKVKLIPREAMVAWANRPRWRRPCPAPDLSFHSSTHLS